MNGQIQRVSEFGIEVSILIIVVYFNNSIKIEKS